MTGIKNVLGDELEVCCTSPLTGFHRNGKYETGRSDLGTHVVCAQVTEKFLAYTKSQGNDLTTPSPANAFPGLRATARNNYTSCLFIGPSTALHPPTHIPICAGGCAL